MCFTGHTFGAENSFQAFFWFSIGFVLLKFLLAESIPDYSESVELALERHKMVEERALAKGARNVSQELYGTKIDFNIAFTDQVDKTLFNNDEG